MFNIDDGFNRLIRLQGSDPGFVSLAYLCFLEGWLREAMRCYGKTDVSFLELIVRFECEVLNRTHAPRYVHDYRVKNSTLRGLLDYRTKSNDVRHRFLNVTIEETRMIMQLFISFCRISKLASPDHIKRLEESFAAWTSSKSMYETFRELQSINLAMMQLEREHSQLSGKAARAAEILQTLDENEKQIRSMEQQIRELEATKDKRSEKIDQLRSRNNELMLNNRNLTDTLETMNEAREYLDLKIRLALYTRTRFDFEREVTRLTPDQQETVHRILPKTADGELKSFFVQGRPGTGKTMVLIAAMAEYLKNSAANHDENTPGRVFLLTYTHALTKYNAYLASIMPNGLPELPVQTCDAYIQNFMRAAGYSGTHTMTYDHKDFLNLLREKGREFETRSVPFSVEVEYMILPQGFTRDEYLGKNARTGAVNPLPVREREKYWELFEQVMAEMESQPVWPKIYAHYRFLLYLKAASKENVIPTAEHLFIDEVQDLSPVDVEILKISCSGSVIMAGDSDQAIFQPGFSFSRIGISLAGRSRILRTNFRNAEPIARLAAALQKHSAAALRNRSATGRDETATPDVTTEYYREGPPVELILESTREAMLESLGSHLKLYISTLGYDPENIAVVVPQNSIIDSIATVISSRWNFPTARVNDSEFSFRSQSGIRLLTLQSSKGLDFPVVILYLPQSIRLSTEMEKIQQGSYRSLVRNLLYVSVSRAMAQLTIITKREYAEDGNPDHEPYRELISLVTSIRDEAGKVR